MSKKSILKILEKHINRIIRKIRKKIKGTEGETEIKNVPTLLQSPENKRSSQTEYFQHINSKSNKIMNRKNLLNSKFIQEWLVVLFTGIMAFYTIKLFSIAVVQTIIANKNADAAITAANAAVISVKATEKSIQLSKQIADSSIKFTKLGMRAYLTVDSIFIARFTINRGLKILFFINNYGSTPASRITIRASMKVGGTGIYKSEFDELKEIGTTTASLGSNKSFSVEYGGSFILSEVDSSMIKNGRKPLYFWGIIRYYDIFGENHHTKFCTEYRRNDICEGFTIYGNCNETK